MKNKDFDHDAHAQALQRTHLVLAGVDWDLADKCAEILVRDEEQTEEETALIQDAYRQIAEFE
jgi:hypothetical protein